MNADMVAEYTPAPGLEAVHPGSTYDDGLGIRLGAGRSGPTSRTYDRAVHHRAVLPAVDPG